MKEIHEIILEDGDVEIIKNLKTESVCSRRGCLDTPFCCGCDEQRKWEKDVKPYRNTPYWDLAKKYNEYKNTKIHIEELEQELKESKKQLASLKAELKELRLLED